MTVSETYRIVRPHKDTKSARLMRARPFKGRAKIRLATWRDVRGEIARVYKAGVAGELPWQDATRAAHILSIIAQLDQGVGIDARLRELEERLSLKPNANGHAPEAPL